VAIADQNGAQSAAGSAQKNQSDNPDDIDQTDEPVRVETLAISNPRAAAWASFCQALLASAEFRYLR
jgi:hypothetical protein